MMGFSYEKRALKRPRLGPPDVYPQEPKQKEDELTTINVKHGFATMPQLTDEFGTARNCNITASKVGAYFNAILTKKEELNTLPDTGRKRQQINPKDNFWPATARTKTAIEAWFKDLAGSKPLSILSKKAPNFNKKEDIFIMLCEYQVPMLRAAWFIKLSYAYTVAVSEVKIKKRQLPDPSQEWTATLIKFLKDQLNKLQDYYHQSNNSNSGSNSTPSNSNTNTSTPTPATTNITTTNTTLTTTAAGIQPQISTPSGNTPQHPGASPAPVPQVPAMTEEQKLAQKQWHYCAQLAKYLYEEGLLERQEFLQWILELLDKMRSSPADDGILKLLLPLSLQYLDEFVQSELLARKLAFLCAKKLSQLCSAASEMSTNATASSGLAPGASPQSPLIAPNSVNVLAPAVPVNPLVVTFNEYMTCPHHRDLVLGLSAILQAITLECPTALVWNCVGEGKSPSVLNGSPLDHLPCAPSTLPMPQRANNPAVRRQLRAAEDHIRQRSRAAEGRWSCDKWQQSSAGRTTAKVLTALDALDRHSFDRMDATNSLDTLYGKIFSPPGTKESTASGNVVNSCANNNVTTNGSTGNNGTEVPRDNRADYTLMQDEAVVQILCEWAVSSQRSGEHRAMAVAKLLEKRQSDLLSGDSDTADEKDSVSSANGAPTGLPVFQPLLMRFLDNDAPVLEDNPSPQNRAMFTNLVHLFSELVRHDIFSHDVYMCTLISRGDLNTGGPAAAGGATTPHHPTSNKPATPADSRGPVVSNPSLQDDDGSLFPGIDLKPTKLEVPDHGRNMDYDDSKIDDDLDKLLQHIKEEQQNSMDAPDSPKDDGVPPGSLVAPPMASVTPMEGVETAGSGETRSRHLLYTTHFPLPQDEPCSLHDCNQRHVLLYGVGKVRDEARHTVKKMTKEICKLFSKKFSIDVAEGGKVKKHSRGEFNFEATTAKVQGLSYFDQHVVTWQCAMTVVEMMNSFASGNSNYLPVQEHVAFLFDLMELALSIYGLIDVCIQILKELPEVEAQLQAKGSGLVRSYTTSLSLYVVGVLRRYHCCLLLFPEQTTLVFEGLCRVVKHVTNPGDCSSAERCVLAHLYDLYSSCSLLKSKPHCVEPFGNAYPKIRQALYSSLQPSSSNHVCNAQFMAEVFSSPRRGGKIEPQWARQLAETPNNRYSFVCNAVVAVCNETDNDRLNDLAILCAELTACCNALSAEWLGVLMALCCSSNHSSHFIDVLAQVDVQDLSIHNSLAVFTSILIARHCFSLEDFVVHIALPSLVKACNEGRGDADIEAEAGARLTCHLLLRLFKTVECPQPALYSVGTSPHPVPNAVSPGYSIKLSCDRHLLAAAHNNIRVGPVLAVLKAILVVGDATAREGKPPSSKSKTEQSQQLHTSNSGNGNKPPVSGSTSGELSISHILGTSDILGGGDDPLLDLAVVDMEPTTRAAQRAITSSVSNTTGTIENAAGLSDFAQHVLRQICSQEWVLERCLQNPEELCHPDMLLDSMLTPKQAQRLLHMICYPDTTASNEEFLDQRQIIARILENLDQWTLRMSWLDLQLMFTQFPSGSAELNQWLDTVAKAAIDVFQLTNSGVGGGGDGKEEKRGGKPGSIWLVAPLVSKLPSAVQGRVLKVAGQVLESGNWSSKNRDKERNVQRSSSLLSHQPFLSLVLTCLKGQDDQREGLLTSLHSQLSQFLCLSKDERLSNYEDIKGRALMQDALQLRFSLVGGMFDTIQRNTTVTTDWAILLVQLISYIVIDLNNNSELFTTVIDMLGTLIHSTLVSDSQSEKEENRKHYQNLMKKLKKELGDRMSPSIQHVRQLLPLPKVMAEVVVCQPMGCLTDTKGNKIAGFDSIDKKQGLQVFEKQRVSPWDLLEGHKNPAPLSWSWFGAIRMERKPLWYEDTHRLLKYHTHSLLKSPNYFLDMPPLPPEDLEPPQEKPLKDDGKADTPNSSDQSPRGPGGSKRVKAQRRRRAKGGAPGGPANGQPVMPGLPQQVQPQQQPQPPVQHMAYPNQGSMFPAQAQWGGYGQQQQQPPQQQQPQQQQPPPQQPQPQPQQGYYPSQQIPAVGPPRYERPINQSKQALSQMLRMRMPGNQFMGAQPPGFPQGMQRQQFIRQQLRASHGGPAMQPPPQQGMFSQQQSAPMYANMQQGMNQNYGGYGGQPGPQMVPQQQLMGQGGQAMMGGFPGQQGGGFVPQQQPPPGMMGTGGPMPPQQPRGAGGPADYMGPQSAMSAQQQRAMAQQGARPPYLQAPNVTMTTMGGPMGQQGQGQPQPAPPYGRAGAGAQGPPPTHASQQQQQNQQFQQRMRQMLVMQQQQQQQGPNQQASQQPQTALVAQLQRTLSQQQQPGGNPQAQQHNPYTHQGHQPPPY